MEKGGETKTQYYIPLVKFKRKPFLPLTELVSSEDNVLVHSLFVSYVPY